MKKILLVCFLITGLCAFSQKKGKEKEKPVVNADDILGVWASNMEKGHVEITRDGDKYHGKIVWLKVPTYPDGTPKLDKYNPDKTKRTDPLIGLYPLKDLVFVKDHWENGTIYDPESGKTYSCRITLKEGKLDLRGYIGLSQIGRTQTWTKVSSNETTNN